MALIRLSSEAVAIIPAREDSVSEGGFWSLGRDVDPSMDVTDKDMIPPSDRGLFMAQDSVANDSPPPKRQKLSQATTTSFDICTNPPHQAYSSAEAAPSSSPSSHHCGTPVSSVRKRKVCQPHSQGFGDHTYCRQQPRAPSRPCSRKPRGNVRKCRSVYGMGQRAKWCKSCRWKKACQCFLDCSEE